jgi:Sulfotransferase family
MIISRRHGFIFIHIPKTGGTSVEVALAPHLAWDDLILGSTPLGFAMNEPYLTQYGLHDHGSLSEIAAVCGPDVPNSSFIFTMVRHPLDRIISLYCFLHSLVENHCHAFRLSSDLMRQRIAAGETVGEPDFCSWQICKIYAREDGFSGFIQAVDTTLDEGLQSQISFLAPPEGVKPVDRVVKLEEIDDAFPDVARQLGLTVIPGRLNASSLHPVTRGDLTRADRSRIAEMYQEDLLAFDYRMP